VLAYVFWHRPGDGTDRAEYEDRQRAFHRAIADAVRSSATFRVEQLPFEDAKREGYEDWYLVDDWAALGALNDEAVKGARRPVHDAAAAEAREGWAGVYRLVRGEPSPPMSARWEAKPPGTSYDDYLASRDEPMIWQRQLTLGPAGEFCLGGGNPSTGRAAIWPSLG
jgi:hypothetical protein